MGGYGLFWVAVGDLVGDSVITSPCLSKTCPYLSKILVKLDTNTLKSQVALRNV